MIKTGKVWGHTELLVSKPTFELHRIEAVKGGYCSVHLHEDKVNLFCVERGKLQIEVWKKDYDLCDLTVIEVGEQTAVAAGEYHRFTALEPLVCFEVYWPTIWAKLERDIVRLNPGGVLEPFSNLDRLPVPDIQR